MATLASLTQRLRDMVYSARPAERPFTAKLGAGYTDVATTIAVPNGAYWEVGDVLENLDTGEQVYVTAVAGNNLTVDRSYNGTTNVAGSTGDYVVKNPRFTTQVLEAAIDSAMQDLSSHGVFQLSTTTFTLVTATHIYDVPMADLHQPVGVVGVYIIEDSYNTPEPLVFRLHHRAHTDLVASGEAIELPAWWGSAAVAQTVYVLYAADIDATTELTVPQERIVLDGATAELLLDTTGPRSHDPGHQTDRTIQAGQGGRDARFYQGKHLTAVRREAARLAVEVQHLRSSYATVLSNRARRFVR